MKIYKTFALALVCALFIMACGNLAVKDRTPIETLKGLNEASKKKDVEGIKKHLSKGTLKLLDNAALAEKTTPDELLKKEGGAPMADLPEITGERIEGDNAYVQIKNPFTKAPEEMPLVKEDGQWKVALDKYLETMKQKYDEEMKKLEQNPNSSMPSVNSDNSPTSSNSNSSKQ